MRKINCLDRIIKRVDDYRAVLMLLTLYVFLSVRAPDFFSIKNTATILEGASLNAIVAIGFTLVFILGQLDLSIGAVLMLCGMLAIGEQSRIEGMLLSTDMSEGSAYVLGWAGGMLISISAGALIGLANGLLVVKAKINSFIVTLGTMTVVMGLMYIYCDGNTMNITNYRLTDWLTQPLNEWSVSQMFPPVVLITMLLTGICAVLLKCTAFGRNLFVIGGDPETAWLAGLNRDAYLIGGFMFCSMMAAVGGMLFAATLSSMPATAITGNRTLMTVLAAVIIGGTLMTGGKGSVVKSYVAILLLTTLFNGISCFGYDFDVQIFTNGLILAIVVLYEAYAIYRHNLLKGQRPDLLNEVAEGFTVENTMEYNKEEGEEETMNTKDRFPLVCVTAIAIVAIVAIMAMMMNKQQVVAVPSGSMPAVTSNQPGAVATVDASVDVYALKGSDNQPLILEASGEKKIPTRPKNPKTLAKEEKGHWWDIEFAGWQVEKVSMPTSPEDGPKDKYVILLKAGDHPYWTAYVNGFTQMAKAHGMKTKVLNGNWSVDLQSQQTNQAINAKPDMIIFAPVDAIACTPLLRKINKAGIPCIASNTIPCDEAMKYCLSWTGPDDWGQFRMLSRSFADALGKKGGYAIVRHMPGSSCFFARTYAGITELKEYAPEMKMLAMDTANLKTEATMQLVSAWLSKYGKDLKGLILAGDGYSMTGTIEAVKKAGRDDIVIVAAGNSKTGMDSIKEGRALAITYQSAEGDGAIAIHTAARWFKGEKLAPVIYLPKHVITKKDVDTYMPAQW